MGLPVSLVSELVVDFIKLGIKADDPEAKV